MAPTMFPYLVIAACAALPAFFATPMALRLSVRLGAVDIPDDRKVHAVPTPRLGGLAIFVAVLVGTGVASVLGPFRQSFQPLFAWPPSEPVAITIGAAIVFLLGLVDDMKGLAPTTKFAGQILAAGFVFLGGVRLEWFRLPPFGTLSLGSSDSAILTIAWIVVIVNALNLIDGLDGLAAGITVIAASTFFIYSFQLSRQLATPEQLEQSAPLISALALGSAAGFLPHNFHPAKIFMGDSGAMTLGFLLATATVVGVGRSAPANFKAESVIFYLPVVIPLVILAIPILDTALAVLRRARRGVDVFHADKRHIHHRLLEIGHGHRQAVLIMYAWTAVIAGAGLALSIAPNPLFTIPFIAAAIAILLYTVLPRLARRGADAPSSPV
jgi:UDP-GlcNAc:undecaprenyl-phosphate GlcNAc-1-phosphate transferase